MASDHKTLDRGVPQRVRVHVIERAQVETDWSGPTHDLPAVTALIAVPVDDRSFLILVAVFPRPCAATHDLLARLNVNEFLIREQAQLARPVHLNPCEQLCGHRRIDEAHNPRALAVAEARAPLDNSVCQVLGRVGRESHEEAEHFDDRDVLRSLDVVQRHELRVAQRFVADSDPGHYLPSFTLVFLISAGSQ